MTTNTYQSLNGDGLTLLRDMQDESVDLIVTDPPYESMNRHLAVGTTTRLKKNWFPVMTNDSLAKAIHELYRVLKTDSHCYIICDQETHYVVRDAALACGFTWHKLLIWDKECIGMGYHWRNRHEVVCFIEKGKRKLNNLGWPDVLRHKRIRGGYPTEKPVSLLKQLVENSSKQGEIVLDPFFGSGSTLDAALSTGRNALGFELSETACKAVHERLSPYNQTDTLFVPRQQLTLANF